MATTLNLGKVMVTPGGEHDTSTAYERLTLVTSGGSSYISKKDVPAGVALTDTTYWQLHGAKGADGTNGTNGVDGEDAYQPFKGWFDSSSALSSAYPSPQVGDFAYVKGATSTDPVAIYACSTAGTWADSGNTFNPANNQEFASGEALNTVHIVDGLESLSATDVLSAKQGKVLDQKVADLGPKVVRIEERTSKPTTENGWFVADAFRNVAMKYDNGGFDVAKISLHLVSLIKGLVNIAKTNNDGLAFVDSELNIGVLIDSNGIHAKNILEYKLK